MPQVAKLARRARYGLAAIAVVALWGVIVTPMAALDWVVVVDGYAIDPLGSGLGRVWQPLLFAVGGGLSLYVYEKARERGGNGFAWPLGIACLVGISSLTLLNCSGALWRVMSRVGVDVLSCVGVALAVGFLAKRNEDRVPTWPAWGLLLALIVQSMSFSQVALRFHAWRYEDRLDAMLTQVRGAPDRGYGAIEGTAYLVERDGVLRVAFEVPGRFLDNWVGFVFDESGLVESAMSVEAEPNDVNARGLFGGTIYYVLPLGEGWYACGFT